MVKDKQLANGKMLDDTFKAVSKAVWEFTKVLKAI